MIIFDGNTTAKKREEKLKQKIADLNVSPVIAAILFIEDAGSKLYTNLKKEAAQRIGVEYRVIEFSLKESVAVIQAKLEELGKNPEITGVIIQKPWRKTWVAAQGEQFKNHVSNEPNPRKYERDQYASWWTKLTSYIAEHKDIDGLHPITIKQISDESWEKQGKVLPATAQAVLTILDLAEVALTTQHSQEKARKLLDGKYIIVGKSDLVGIPLFYELRKQGKDVEIIASKELTERMKSGQQLLDASVIISATGRKNLITGEMVSDDVVVIDVGEPRADVEFETVKEKASFITPVPGGVGPMTVVSLLENCAQLCEYRKAHK